MSVIDSRAKLIMAAKKLTVEWHRTREMWRDENARQFDQKYMSPLETHIRATVLAMERMGNALESARADCKDDTGYGR
ncbi:MAG: hypothetical protein ACYTAS_11715 [Planctomycetota bacterium]|jgi:hypothetical protein